MYNEFAFGDIERSAHIVRSMTRKHRLMYFGIVVVVFCILSPILLLYVAGYRYDSKSQEVEKTGTIHVRTFPKQASVRLNSELQDVETPASYNGLARGLYDICVEKEGFQSWRKQLSVDEGLVTRTDYLYLFPTDAQKKEVVNAEVVDFAFSPNGQRGAVITHDPGSSRHSLLVFSLDSPDEPLIHADSTNPPSSFGDKGSEMEFRALSWSADNSFLLLAYSISSTHENDLRYAVFETKRDGDIIFLDALHNIPFSHVRWHTTDHSTIVFTDDAGQVFIQTFKGNVVHAPLRFFDVRVEVFELSGEYLFYLRDSDHLVYRVPLAGGEHVQLTRIPLVSAHPEHPMSFGSDVHLLPFFSISREGSVAMIDAEHILYIADPLAVDGVQKIAANVSLFAWQLDSKKLAYTVDNELWVYFVRDKESYPQVQRGHHELIVRLSEPINAIRWFYSYEYIMFSTLNVLKVAELDGRDVRNIVDLADIQTEKPFFDYHPEQESLYLWDKTLTSIALETP